MALEDTDNVDTGPESNGNGDERSNRTFRILMLALGGIGVLALILIGASLIGQQGVRQQIAATSQAIQATNDAVALLAAITPVPPTPMLPAPTNTSVPPTATLPPTAAPTKPAPTVTSTTASGANATAEPTKAGAAGAETPKPGATTSGQKPAATSSSGTVAPKVTASSGVTTTKPTSGTVSGGETQVPKTGAGDSIGLIALAAGLVAVFVIARRLRTTQA